MQLSQDKAIRLLEKYNIPVCRSDLLRLERLYDIRIAYPVVIKTAAPEVLHKSDIGAVRTGIMNKEDLIAAAKEISDKVRSRFPSAEDIFLVQEEIKGKELIIGMKRDPSFGPVIMFGLGGIFVEAFKDVSFRIAPIKHKDALAMINEIKGSAILKGIRGESPVDIGSVADILMKVARLSMDNREISELDLNPVMANQHGAKAVDVRIMGDFH